MCDGLVTPCALRPLLILTCSFQSNVCSVLGSSYRSALVGSWNHAGGQCAQAIAASRRKRIAHVSSPQRAQHNLTARSWDPQPIAIHVCSTSPGANRGDPATEALERCLSQGEVIWQQTAPGRAQSRLRAVYPGVDGIFADDHGGLTVSTQRADSRTPQDLRQSDMRRVSLRFLPESLPSAKQGGVLSWTSGLAGPDRFDSFSGCVQADCTPASRTDQPPGANFPDTAWTKPKEIVKDIVETAGNTRPLSHSCWR